MAVLDLVGVGAAHVYGTSMGGRIAQMLPPERIRRLVLACTTPGGPHARERGLQVRRLLAQPDRQARRQALLDLMYTPDWPHRERSSLLGDPTMTADAQRRHLRASAGHDAYDRLPLITAPTLILHGSDDLMAPVENAQLIAERIPNAQVRITERGRHGFFDEFSESVTRDVLDFLT
jgi:pimeloyl-ACP methyl ester carboxylesterase